MMNTRITDVIYKIRLFFIPYLIVLIACLIIKITYTREEIYFSVNKLYTHTGDFVFPYLTDLGEGYMVITLTLIMLCLSYRKCLLLGTSFAISGILVQIVKHIYHAPRPVIYFEKDAALIHYVKGIRMMEYNSFPSGHTVTAFSAAVVLSYISVNKRYGFIFLLLAIGVAYSRMYLSQHFFEDVTAGSILGTFCTIMWVTWLDNKGFMHSQRWAKGLIKKK
jgi:membrane-associated phospholipid phosphatase